MQIVRATHARARISTSLGDFVVEADLVRAPITARNFVDYVARGLLDNTSVYRIVAPRNQGIDVPVKIEGVQFGLTAAEKVDPKPLPPIPHETTASTGLCHRDGTISMARLAAGTASSGFFICI